MEVVDDQHDDFGLFRELRDDCFDHRVAIERWGSRLGSGVSRGGRLADRVQNGEPELLGILLVARHRHECDPTILAGAVSPRT